MLYNPFDPVAIIINGTGFSARPVEFDSTPSRGSDHLNDFGGFVKPSRITTTCPDCGQGLMFDVQLSDPPFGAVELDCYICKPAPKIVADPFVDPIKSGIVDRSDLESDLFKPGEVLEVEPLPLEVVDEVPEPVKTSKNTPKTSLPKKNSSRSKSRRKSKAVVADDFIEYPKISEPVQTETGLGEEIDFDDEDLLS